jgi:hypothetical protein
MRQTYKPMTAAELLALPAAVDLPTACRALNIGRTVGYALARTGEFPVTARKIGKGYRVPSAELRRYLKVEAPAA